MLDVTIVKSNNLIRRGDTFSIYVDIKNAYETPVTLQNIKLNTPIGFSTSGKKPNWVTRISKMNLDLGVTGLEFEFNPYKKSDYNVEKSDDGATKFDEFILQPNSTYRAEFVLQAGNRIGIRPRPDTYTISCKVDYTLTDNLHQHPVDIEISIFPSMAGMLVGTVIGSILGTIISENFVIDEKSWPKILGNGILGFIAGVILMRKKDVQPFITIEDFWGGILLGFVVGYSGDQVFKGLLPTIEP